LPHLEQRSTPLLGLAKAGQRLDELDILPFWFFAHLDGLVDDWRWLALAHPERQQDVHAMSVGTADDLGARTTGSDGWIQSQGFDLLFFILSPIAGLAVIFAAPTSIGPVLALAAATLIGGPHYMATYSFYFFDDTAAYQKQRWVAYFLVPILIVFGVGVVALFEIPAIIIVVVFFWNAFHVARQSCGILSIYRRRAGYGDQRHRSITNFAILSTSFAMALAHIDWYPALNNTLLKISPYLPLLLSRVTLAAAVVSLAALGVSIVQRFQSGSRYTVAEFGFLVTSLLLFHPYLWVEDSNLATLGMLLGHFIQYLGIVWLLTSRKLADGSGSRGQRWLSRIWLDPWILLPSALLIGGLFMVLQINFMALTMALVLLHFYLDGLFWAFSRPVIRNAITPYLTGGPPQAVTAK
jgi:hypothetical protein